MYRVLAARSLKFLEQRQEDTINYQRQFKDQSSTLRPHRAGIYETKEEDDYHGRVKETAQGGSFHVTYPDKVANAGSNGSYSRQVGERVQSTTPLIGGKNATTTTKDGEGASAQPKGHAQIIVHEKKDKSDQLNLRIQTSVERQKLRSSILVDEVVQKRLKKKKEKDLSVSNSLAKLRGQKQIQSHVTILSNKEQLGVGLWSSLGEKYQEQGHPDVDLPELNQDVPVREITKSKHSRPPLLKEASDHRRKYENLIELFRQQRHRVMKPRPRDGQDGVPRDERVNKLTGNTAAMNSALAQSQIAWDVHPAITDLSTSYDNGPNPATQSLLARLYQTQNQISGGGGSGTNSGGSGDHSHDASEVSSLKRSAHSASTGALRDTGKTGVKIAELPATSVERIAALQPRKYGWDATSIRPLASSASVPNFERRTTSQLAHASAGMGQMAQKSTSQHTLLNSLPENHPAQMHASVLPQTMKPGEFKPIVEGETPNWKPNTLGSSASTGSLSTFSPTGGHRPPPSRVKFSTSLNKAGLSSGSGVLLSPDHPDYLKRKQENYSMAMARNAKKRAKEEEERELYEQVIKQLSESRLDHLHRWRNAFDGTKQRMDRMLIKRLVSRAEQRAAALESGSLALAPHIDQVLTEQELTQVVGDPAAHARLSTHHKQVKHAEAWSRDAMLQDDFADHVYDEHSKIRDIVEGDESQHQEGEEEDEVYNDSTAREEAKMKKFQQAVDLDPSALPQHFYQELPTYATKQTNKSGTQQHHTANHTPKLR